MKKLLFFSLMLAVSMPIMASDFSSAIKSDTEKSFNRSLEIRYIVGHPADQNFIMVDEKKYLVFSSKEAAISYGENMSLKSDLTIVYVRAENLKEKEIIELSE